MLAESLRIVGDLRKHPIAAILCEFAAVLAADADSPSSPAPRRRGGAVRGTRRRRTHMASQMNERTLDRSTPKSTIQPFPMPGSEADADR